MIATVAVLLAVQIARENVVSAAENFVTQSAEQHAAAKLKPTPQTHPHWSRVNYCRPSQGPAAACGLHRVQISSWGFLYFTRSN